MSTNALGIKRHCHSCGTKFYDLNRTPIICPSCNTEFDPEVLLKSRRVKPVAQPAVKAVVAEPKPTEIEEDIDEVDDEIESETTVLDDESDIIPVAAGQDEEEIISPADDVVIEGELDVIDAEDSEE
mgnify:FL=1|jgi:uncharacterized protein (TIGR02300 family)